MDELVKRLRHRAFARLSLKRPSNVDVRDAGLDEEAANFIEAQAAEIEALREALVRIEDLTQHDMGMSSAEERCVNREARAALHGEGE